MATGGAPPVIPQEVESRLKALEEAFTNQQQLLTASKAREDFLNKELIATKERTDKALAERLINVEKIGRAFHVLHTPEGQKWKDAGLTIGGRFFERQQSLYQLWQLGTPEEVFRILYEGSIGTRDLPQVIAKDTTLWGYTSKQDLGANIINPFPRPCKALQPQEFLPVNDLHFQSLKDKKGAQQEYRTLYTALSYLSDCAAHLAACSWTENPRVDVFAYREASAIACGQVAGVCTILYNRLARLIALNSADSRIANAARLDLESDIQLNSNYTTKEVRDLVSGLRVTEPTSNVSGRRNKGKGKGKPYKSQE